MPKVVTNKKAKPVATTDDLKRFEAAEKKGISIPSADADAPKIWNGTKWTTKEK